MRIGVTGANGFLGWHLRAFLHARKEHIVVPIGREDFSDRNRLHQRTAGCDAIVHLAGMNRGDDSEILRVNAALAEELTAACDSTGARPHIVYANSTHSARETTYGRSKRRAAETLASWAERMGTRFTDLVLPNLFGEHGRPFYNSAVATFCHQLAHGETARIFDDIELELVHAQTAAEAMLGAIRDGTVGSVRVSGRRLLVSEALDRLREMAEQYRAQLIPELADILDLALFNTYRSYLFPQSYPVRPPLHSDARGSLFEAVKTLRGGQAFFSSTRPGATRGKHYHCRKIERFLVVQGEAVIRVRRLLHPQAHEFRVSGSAPGYIDMPTFHTHDITNVGSGELLTLFWSHELFDRHDPDTYSEQV